MSMNRLLDAFTQAVDTLMTNSGRVDMPWGEVNRLMRGPVDLPTGGGPDLLHAKKTSGFCKTRKFLTISNQL